MATGAERRGGRYTGEGDVMWYGEFGRGDRVGDNRNNNAARRCTPSSQGQTDWGAASDAAGRCGIEGVGT